MEQFRKQLVGIALILLGMVFSISAITFDIWVPIISSMPWGGLGIVTSIIGVVIVCKNSKDNSDKSE